MLQLFICMITDTYSWLDVTDNANYRAKVSMHLCMYQHLNIVKIRTSALCIYLSLLCKNVHSSLYLYFYSVLNASFSFLFNFHFITILIRLATSTMLKTSSYLGWLNNIANTRYLTLEILYYKQTNLTSIGCYYSLMIISIEIS